MKLMNSSRRSQAAESDLKYPQAVEIGLTRSNFSSCGNVSKFSPPSGEIRDTKKRGKLTKIWGSGSW